ncbi:hypothetical protein SERLA73DRAFT_187590 [Serpula lacrymans var. lacrymans S7.3]|uniref:Uncharacterized protein n=2 Tax=Serpula lacrymans var. lacrymans TaxID=341189 RepID=F8Q9L8_SERL3|nr:uncharacterized protein SERLADRAFT_417885 [Serpula lacrymans var. lacrymans S7.9]XP_007322765.1 uncharacterized protein SERLADRAFT_477279 [Serpula lacrymans var. lacrymans S7.9]EGN95273.1 hypothetical protein SERLA73DRAFT_187590 [Serpula lacrymans var. lacrymans S7.3]EGO20768.1 hypothetical protein SERLADRAFT_417885 [Serpula lacrymans var. lacrymans S7.9]EGO20799.1 hypothetical protein SERLADRAFT_477279 [Serpula lacrymans var. lacrymans S7.9]
MATTSASDSKRWTHFHSALQLAIQRSARQWTYEDFTEYFSLWCKEEPNGASAVFNAVSRHMESTISNSCEDLFKEYNVRESINILHAVVTEARARKQRGELSGKDVWKEDLQPRAAGRAHVVPILEGEVDRLKATLKALEEENLKLQAQFQENVRKQEETDAKTTELLDILDDIYHKWNKLPHEDMELWTLQTAESLGSTRPP